MSSCLVYFLRYLGSLRFGFTRRRKSLIPKLRQMELISFERQFYLNRKTGSSEKVIGWRPALSPCKTYPSKENINNTLKITQKPLVLGAGRRMTCWSQTLKEASGMKIFLSTRVTTIIGAWNIRTVHEAGTPSVNPNALSAC